MRVFLHESGHYLDFNALGNGKTIRDSLPELRKKLQMEALIFSNKVLQLEKPVKSIKDLKAVSYGRNQSLLYNSLKGELKNGISDIFSGLTKKSVFGDFIHPPSYWKGDALEAETIAHFFEARAVGGEKLKLLKEVFPTTYDYFDNFIKENLEK